MEVLNFIFRLGVIFAIFGFIWWLINTGLSLIRGGSPKSQAEIYILKFVRYFFLVDVTFLFCMSQLGGEINLPRLIVAGGVLLMYFLGKLQNAKLKQAFMQVQGNMLNRGVETFNKKNEAIVIGLSLLIFSLFIVKPELSNNPISEWFYDSILNIESTPIFGFVFKIIGFFFMLSIIMKLVNSINVLINGRPNESTFDEMNTGSRIDSQRKDDDFDDYEEVE